MSREIKFRGYNYHTRTMHYFQYPGMVNGGPYHPGCLYCYECGCYVGPEDIDLMQFTGLRDKQGREIYEGDIVEISWYWSKFMRRRQIVEYVGATFLPFGDDDYGWENTHCTVIGNIYENSELLEEGMNE